MPGGIQHERLPMRAIKAFCERWEVSEFSLFGSVLNREFSDDSDMDVMVSFAPEAHRSLFDMITMREELKEVFGRDVDLVSRQGIESSRNAYRRQAILDSAERVYGP